MKKWEYAKIEAGSAKRNEATAEMNNLGNEGWRVISTSVDSNGTLLAFLEREKLEKISPVDGD